MRARAALLTLAGCALAAFALAGCSNRERDNPLDPGNPETGGRPTGFNALAGFLVVQLRWDARPGSRIAGFLIERQAPGEADYSQLGAVLPPSNSQYLDAAVENGRRYRYRLSYLLADGERGVPTRDEATPGGLRPWIVEQGDGRSNGGALTRLSPDGRDVAVRFTGVPGATSLAVDGEAGRVWVSQQQAGRVRVWSVSGFELTNIDFPGAPGSIAIDPELGSAWVCNLNGSLRRYQPNGLPAAPSVIELLASPLGVAVRSNTRAVWLCERDGQRVRRYTGDGAPQSVSYVQAPSRVAADSATGQAWVTSFSTGRVYRIGATGAPVDSFAVASGPIGIAVDALRGRVWVADALGDQIVVIDRTDGHVLTRFTGITEAWDVAVERATGEAWIVSRARGEVWRVDATGTVLDRVGGLASPLEIRLDDGRR